MMRILGFLALLGLVYCGQVVATQASCGTSNPNCIVPTAPFGTNNNQAASTAFVQASAPSGLYGNLSGDCTATSLGVITCLKTNGTLFGTLAIQNANAVAITGGAITGLPTPTTPSAAATKQYVDSSVSAGLVPHSAVALATAAALPANTYSNGSSGVGATLTGNADGALTVDGTVVTSAQRILVKNESAAANNGIYTVTTVGSVSAAYVLTRSTDANTPGTGMPTEIGFGTYVLATAGSANLNSGWSVNSTVTTIGTSAINWSQFSAVTNILLPPGGRLVAVSGSSCSGAPPVQIVSVNSVTTLCEVPMPNMIASMPINGVSYPLSVQTLTLPSAVTSGDQYDVFEIVAAGAAVPCVNTGAWTNSTSFAARLAQSSYGYYANANTITSCVNGATTYSNIAAGNATFVGSFYAIGTGATAWQLDVPPSSGGTPIVGGGFNCVCIFNAYNQVLVTAMERDGAPYFTYGPASGAWVYFDGSTNNAIRVVDGLGFTQYKVSASTAISGLSNSEPQAGSIAVCPDCVITSGNPTAIAGVFPQGGAGATNGIDESIVITGGGTWPSRYDTSYAQPSTYGYHSFSAIISGQSANGAGPNWFGNLNYVLTVQFMD
jgi:hypothetical protein